MSQRTRFAVLTLAIAAGAGCARDRAPAAPAAPVAPAPLEALLEPIRAKHKLPALAAGVIREGRLAALGAVGVRKAGTKIKVTRDDAFHIGSCTKAMTATLIALLVEQGKLRWDMTLPEALPELAKDMHAGYRKVTIQHLLTHRAGLVANVPPGTFFAQLHGLRGTGRQQRLAYARMILGHPSPPSKPGEKFLYSNAGYSIAGAIAEHAADAEYQVLLRRMLLKPLGMTTAGFGAMGTPGKTDQPWQHTLVFGVPMPINPGPKSDNPVVLDPAGRVHCSLADWAKFVAAHLAGPRGGTCPIQLKPETWRRLHTPPAGGDYAMGWAAAQRGWAGGTALTHAGSNTMNFAVVWMAPKRNFAVLVATNQGGDVAPQACDEAAGMLIRRFLPGRTKRGK